MRPNVNDDKTASGRERKHIAIAVSVFSADLLVSVCVVFVQIGGEYEKLGDAAEKTFATLIPLIGIWIGTVPAYYFSGENFPLREWRARHLREGLTSFPP